VIGLREVSRDLVFGSSYTVAQHASREVIEKEIIPGARAAMKNLKDAWESGNHLAVVEQIGKKVSLDEFSQRHEDDEEELRTVEAAMLADGSALLEPGDLTDLLMNTLTGRQGRIAKTLEKVFHGHESPLGKIAMVLAHDVKQQVRMLVTEQLMSLWLPPDTMVQLGRDLTRPFPEALQKLTSPDLLHLDSYALSRIFLCRLPL
jgi:hypothetical protein